MLKFYLTRDSDGGYAELWPEEIGIIERKGCGYYASATLFGFIPEAGKAYYVRNNNKGRLIHTEVCLAFSGASEALDAYPWRLTKQEMKKYLV